LRILAEATGVRGRDSAVVAQIGGLQITINMQPREDWRGNVRRNGVPPAIESDPEKG
jgi:hypothetical protein